MEINIDQVRSHLEDSPLRMTHKRQRILDALTTLDRPVTAEDLRGRADLPKSDLVTVYRTIEAFLSIGILQRIPLENGGTIYELTDPGDHHHHFVCRDCHMTVRLDIFLAKELEKEARNLGFSNISHVMEVYGCCTECKE